MVSSSTIRMGAPDSGPTDKGSGCDGRLGYLLAWGRICEGIPPQLLQKGCERSNFFGKNDPLGSGNPFETEVPLIDPEQLEYLVDFLDHLLTLHITYQVIAVPDVSAGNHHAIGTRCKGVEQKTVVDPAGAHEADHSHVGRVLHAGHARKIRPCIGTPVAHKRDNLRFEVFRHRLSSQLSTPGTLPEPGTHRHYRAHITALTCLSLK